MPVALDDDDVHQPRSDVPAHLREALLNDDACKVPLCEGLLDRGQLAA